MTGGPATVGILHSSNFLEDWLDPLGVSFEAFHSEMVGSWLFGYTEALAAVGVRVVLISASRRVKAPVRMVHAPTGATHWILPAPAALRPALKIPGVRAFSGYLGTPLRALRSALRDEKCDALLVQDYEHQRFDLVVLLGRLLRMPVFASFQGCVESRSRLIRKVRGISLRAAAGIISPTRDETERLGRRYAVPSSRLSRIFNPVDVEFWGGGDHQSARTRLGIPPQATVVVWHGRVDFEYKGLDVLLDSWDRVCSREKAGHPLLLLIGMGADAVELRRRMAQMKPGSIRWIERWMHEREEIRSCLAAADVFAFPSRKEGFPVALLEAMACGLPVVAADASGVEDILVGGEASGGIIVPRGDSSAFASALCRIIDDVALAHDLGTRSRRRAEEAFAPRVVGRQLADLLFSDVAHNSP